jgi:SnoaL-like domain
MTEPSVVSAAELREMKDRQEIEDVLIRYCRGADRGDAELVKSALHEDATSDHGVFRANSREEIAAHLIDRVKSRYAVSLHYVTNVTFRIEGDIAEVESYYIVGHLTRDEDGSRKRVEGAGRYVDTFERRVGQWKILHRTVINEWTHITILEELLQQRANVGYRSQEDLSYRHLGWHRSQPSPMGAPSNESRLDEGRV